MSTLEQLYRQYEQETGDTYPEPPRRMFVRRPSQYTKTARKWIEDDDQWKIRFLDWWLAKLEKEQRDG